MVSDSLWAQMKLTNIRQAHHVCPSPIETHENVVGKNLIWKVNPEDILDEPKASTNSTVFPTQRKEVGEAEDLLSLAKLSLSGDSVDVIFAMSKEAS